MTSSAERLHRSVLLLIAGLLFTAAALRSVLSLAGDPQLAEVLLLLGAWLALFVVTGVASIRWSSVFPLALAAQTLILMVLMAGRDQTGDFYAVLFGVMSMQAAQRLGWKTALLWIALFTPLTALALSFSYDVPEAIAFAVMYAGLDVFLALFTLVTRRAAEARGRNEALAVELGAANREIAAFSREEETLATADERLRLARELHDSVTQTVFSMNLTAQSAALLLPRDRGAAVAQLERLEELGLSALAEIDALGCELGAEERETDDLAVLLRRHLAERQVPEGLRVTVQVEGEADTLSPAERHSLFRIAQEALNNVVKHAQAREAVVRLWQSPPRRLEIVDDGRGFDPQASHSGGGMGLGGMRERASAVGWTLRVMSAPGRGTHVMVEEDRAAPERDIDAGVLEGRAEG